MSQRYAALIERWRAAAARTREAQLALKSKFDAHIAGGPAPSEDEVQHVRDLRDDEGRCLEEAMDYVRRTALGKPTGFGSLD